MMVSLKDGKKNKSVIKKKNYIIPDNLNKSCINFKIQNKNNNKSNNISPIKIVKERFSDIDNEILNKSEINKLNEIFFSESKSQNNENSISINSNINNIFECKIKENNLNINKLFTKEIKPKDECEEISLINNNKNPPKKVEKDLLNEKKNEISEENKINESDLKFYNKPFIKEAIENEKLILNKIKEKIDMTEKIKSILLSEGLVEEVENGVCDELLEIILDLYKDS